MKITIKDYKKLAKLQKGAPKSRVYPALKGVHLTYSGDGNIIAYSTDTYCMARVEIEPIDVAAPFDYTVMIPKLSDYGEYVEIEELDKEVIFRTCGTEISERKIEGRYPDCEWIVKESKHDNIYRIELDARRLMKIIEVCSGGKDSTVNLVINTKGKPVAVEGRDDNGSMMAVIAQRISVRGE